MFKIENASLRVKKIRQSKNGPFAVATLASEVGEFKVKDQLLDQFDEGDYRVTAWIAEIFLGHYVAYGRSVTEIRARLHDLQVESEDEGIHDDGIDSFEPDPIDEASAVSLEATLLQRRDDSGTHTVRPPPQKGIPGSSLDALKSKLKGIGRKSRTPAASSVEDPATSPGDELAALFAEDLWMLIQAREPVKLDATVDRARFRRQAVVLVEQLNYKFDSKKQAFNPL